MNNLLKEKIFTRANINYQEKHSKYEDWFLEMEKPEVIEYIELQKSLFLAVKIYFIHL